MALTRSHDPLVWIDCEMKGLDPETDTILSISCIVTDSSLNPVKSALLTPPRLPPPASTPTPETKPNHKQGFLPTRISEESSVVTTTAADDTAAYDDSNNKDNDNNFITAASPEDPYESFDAIISHTRAQLDSMSDWCRTTHGATGLTAQCLAGPPVTTTAAQAAAALLRYIQARVPEARTALLAGNSVHVDKLFLMRGPWRPVVEYLHYRILDVSAIKEGVRRWCPEEVLAAAPGKKLGHTAAEDVRESLEEARFYMGLFREMKVS